MGSPLLKAVVCSAHSERDSFGDDSSYAKLESGGMQMNLSS